MSISDGIVGWKRGVEEEEVLALLSRGECAEGGRK
jgi:hypothetical protein